MAPEKQAPFWVAIGASAGGLEALRFLVRDLPVSLPAALIVVQHAATDRPSLLAEILSRETALPVRAIEDGMVPQAGVIHIAPPGFDLLAREGRLGLRAPAPGSRRPCPSVDAFLAAAAREKGRHAIAVILSGAGTDGTAGIAAIRQAGGLVVAQSEASAPHASMPVSAIRTGQVDLVMTPEDIGAALPGLARLPRRLSLAQPVAGAEPELAPLMTLIRQATGVDFSGYKAATLRRRIDRRIAATKASDLDGYLHLAEQSPGEVERLFADLLISVTGFFRDRPEFEALAAQLASRVVTEDRDRLRVWVPGVATGEEAYSIAILLLEALGRAGAGPPIEVIATDIDHSALESARIGLFAESAFADVPPGIVSRYFEPAPGGRSAGPALRAAVRFSHHNLVQDPPPTDLDLVSCRNVLIYFRQPLQARVLADFHRALRPGGLLFLGKSETASAAPSLFAPADGERHIFIRQDPGAESPATATGQEDQPREDGARPVDPDSRFAGLVRALGPDAILVDGTLEILARFGDLERQVDPEETGRRHVRAVLREPYRQEVLAHAPGVLRTGLSHTGGIRAQPDGRHFERTIIHPVAAADGTAREALVVFSRWSEPAPPDGGSESRDALRRRVESLSEELSIASSTVSRMGRQLEGSHEELQSLYEALQVSNEELQATNEELETANEELQSANEELATVNQELQVNSHQLSTLNRSLRSILDNVGVPLLVVDRDLSITDRSRAALDHFGLPASGRLHLSDCRLPPGHADPAAIARAAIESGRPQRTYVETGDIDALLRAVPHRDASGETIGAILLVADNTQALREARDELQLIFDNVPAAIMVRDAEGRILKANPAFRALLSPDQPAIEGSSYYAHFAPETAAEIRAIDREILASAKPSLGLVRHKRYRDGRERWIRVSRIPAADPRTGQPLLYVLEQDITGQVDFEARLMESQARLDQAVAATRLGLGEWPADGERPYWSPRVYEMLGLDPAAYPGGPPPIADFIHPDDAAEVERIRRAHLSGQGPFEAEFRMIAGDERILWVRSHGRLGGGGKGGAPRLIFTLQDITPEKRNLVDILTRKNQLELAATLSGVGHWDADLETGRISWSDQMYRIHGVDRDTYRPMLGNALDFYHPEDRADVVERSEQAARRGEAFEFEARILRPDGAQRMVRVAGIPRLDAGGRLRGAFGVHMDLTDIRERENQMAATLSELARSNEELNRFSYVCSHDMKEPVRMIESMAALLVDPEFQADEATRTDLLARIATNTQRLRAIIDNLLAYSRIDARIRTGPVELDAVLREVCDGLAPAIAARNAQVEFGDMPVLEGAAVHFTQLFQNLVGNALKYNDKPSPLIRVTAQPLAGRWQFTVADNGPGVPPGSRADIFALFTRLKRRDEVEGTGLGLSIAQRIVQQYGGTIACEESALGGAAFVFDLPGNGGSHGPAMD